MKKAMLAIMMMTSTTVMVACGSSKNDATPAANLGCPVGSSYANGYCYNQYGQVINTGGLGFVTANYDNTGYYGGIPTSRTSNMGNYYRTFVKEAMAICDRTDGYSGGTASCDAYVSGYVRVVMQSPNPSSNSLRLTIEAGPSTRSANGWYSISTPTAGQLASCGLTYYITGVCMMYPTASNLSYPRNPLSIDMAVSPINNSAGFEARGYGAYATQAGQELIQMMVPNGKLQDGYFDYTLYYKGQSGGVVLSGRMNRCADASCGLSY